MKCKEFQNLQKRRFIYVKEIIAMLSFAQEEVWVQYKMMFCHWGVDGYIAGGGNYIIYHDKILYNQSFEQDLIKKVVHLLKNRNVAFSIESQKKVFMNQKAKEIFESMNQFKIKHSSTNKQFITEKIIYKNNIDEYEH